MSSGGLDFDSFMRKLVTAPKSKTDKQAEKKTKRKKVAPPLRGR